MLFTYMFAPIMIIVPFYVMMRFARPHQHASRAGRSPIPRSACRSACGCCAPSSSHPARHRGGRDDRWRQRPGRAPCHRAAGAARRDRRPIFTFILAWNDYIFARVLISADESEDAAGRHRRPLQRHVVDWGMIMASRPPGHHSGASSCSPMAEISGRRLGRRRRQGMIGTKTNG